MTGEGRAVAACILSLQDRSRLLADLRLVHWIGVLRHSEICT
jgi:hypothetical protein